MVGRDSFVPDAWHRTTHRKTVPSTHLRLCQQGGSGNRRGVTGGRTATIKSSDEVGRAMLCMERWKVWRTPTVVLSMCAQGVEENIGGDSASQGCQIEPERSEMWTEGVAVSSGHGTMEREEHDVTWGLVPAGVARVMEKRSQELLPVVVGVAR